MLLREVRLAVVTLEGTTPEDLGDEHVRFARRSTGQGEEPSDFKGTAGHWEDRFLSRDSDHICIPYKSRPGNHAALLAKVASLWPAAL